MRTISRLTGSRRRFTRGFTRTGSARVMPHPMAGLWTTLEGATHSSRPAARKMAHRELADASPLVFVDELASR